MITREVPAPKLGLFVVEVLDASGEVVKSYACAADDEISIETIRRTVVDSDPIGG